MSKSTLFPPQHLPPLPNLSETQPSSAEETHLEAIAAALGFEKVFERTFEPLYSELKKPGSSSCWSQWWRHPAGALFIISRFRFHEKGNWIFDNVRIVNQCGYGVGQTHFSKTGHFSNTGMDFNEDGSQFLWYETSLQHKHELHKELGNTWEKIRIQAAEGNLVPFSSWQFGRFLNGQVVESNVYKTPSLYLTSSQTRTFALSGFKADTKTLLSPDLSAIETGLRLRHFSSLAKPWLSDIKNASFSPQEKSIWETFLLLEKTKLNITFRSQKKSSHLPPRHTPTFSRTSLREMRTQYRFEQTAERLNYLLSQMGVPAETRLTESESAITKQWIKTVSDPRHPRHLANEMAQCSALSLPRFGVEFHHLLLQCFDIPGCLRKARWWQHHEDPLNLITWCTTSSRDGRTLPMRWIQAWTNIPNTRVIKRILAARCRTSRLALTHLDTIFSASKWSLETSTRTIWDHALAWSMNLSVDKDLLEARRFSLKEFLDWFSTSSCPHVRNIFMPDKEKSVNIMDAQAIQAAIDEVSTKSSNPLMGRASHQDRIALLLPIQAVLNAMNIARNLNDSMALNQPLLPEKMGRRI